MTDALFGRQLANFRIEYLLGQGGMASVYYGTDVKLRRPVAIKVLDERLQANQAYARRFVREAQTVASWRHENVLQVYYADETDGIYYFVTEYIDGADLGKVLEEYTQRGELIPHADVLRIGHAIASALDFAHQRGVIHRDVKPANVLVERSGRVVLGDFGLALEVQQGTLGEVIGTPHYISPEQARHSAEAVPASDLYSLGVILYEMLTGAVPFDDPSPTTVAIQHITLLPPPPGEINPDLNEETEQVLLKSLSKTPQARYQSGSELMAALEKALAMHPSILSDTPASASFPPGQTREHASLSRLAVLDIIAARPPKTAELLPHKPFEIPASGSGSQSGSRGRLTLPALLSAGAVLIVLVLAVGLAVLLGLNNISREKNETGQARLTTAVVFAAETVVKSTTPVPPSDSTPASSPVLIVVTDTNMPVNNTATTTSIPVETQAPPAEKATSVPTVKYPQGQHFRLYYNENGFYVYSLAEMQIAIEPIAFERQEASGAFSNRFEGFEWAKIYAYIWPKNCLKAEIRDSGQYMPPSVCLGYNAMRTFKRDESVVFWTSRQGAVQFRVLWDEEEIARCEIADGVCEVFLP